MINARCNYRRSGPANFDAGPPIDPQPARQLSDSRDDRSIFDEALGEVPEYFPPELERIASLTR